MNITISKLTLDDLATVDDLMKRHSKTLGFLPEQALREHLERGNVLGAVTTEGLLSGYLLYANYPDRFRIVHLCVDENFKRQGIAKKLVECLKGTATTQKSIQLYCRRDYPAHAMWPKLGFIPLDEKRGRSIAGHSLTFWCLSLAPDEQLSLFQAKLSDNTLDVCIDAQIFFDLYALDNDASIPSKALTSDFLVNTIELCITEELFVEIDRAEDSDRRKFSRNRAHQFRKIESNPSLEEQFKKTLSGLLPHDTLSQKSDIRHLAKTAASTTNTFITRDNALLNRKEEIYNLTGLRVIPPSELIIELHELSEKQAYLPDRISGFQIKWGRVTANDLNNFEYTQFLVYQEKKSHFKQKLHACLAHPNRYICEVLQANSTVMAIRILEEKDTTKELNLCLGRSIQSTDASLYERFLIIHTIHTALERKLEMLTVARDALAPHLTPDLEEMGFEKSGDVFVRFCFTRALDRKTTLARISELHSTVTNIYENMSDTELERRCSPLALSTCKHAFLIPVRPGYAISLINSSQSADDLFGGDIRILLRWDNVYYRKKTRHRMIQAPAQILWYVSRDIKKIVAVSWLDEVEIGEPKELFRKFKKSGVLEWRDIYEMCDGDVSKEIMALKFSHTLPLREQIPLNKLQNIMEKNQAALQLQSVSKLPPKVLGELLQLGYPD